MPNGQQMSNWPAFKHHVLRIRSRRAGNKEWIIDLCGGQYGICSPFHEWSTYSSQFVEAADALFPLGTAQSLFASLSQLRGIPALTYGLVGRAAHALNVGLDAWETQNGPVSKLRALNGVAFHQEKTNLLAALDQAVRGFVTTNNFTAITYQERQHARQYPSEAMACETITEQLYSAANLL